MQVLQRDVDHLASRRHLSDAMIDFYAQYLLEQTADKSKAGILVLPSTLFHSIEAKKPPPLGSMSPADVFSMDVLVFLIDTDHHWFIALVSNLKQVKRYVTNKLQRKNAGVCGSSFVICTSSSLSSQALERKIWCYLTDIWMATSNYIIRMSVLGQVRLSLPSVMAPVEQQHNRNDCGMYVLGYLARFLNADSATRASLLSRLMMTKELWKSS